MRGLCLLIVACAPPPSPPSAQLAPMTVHGSVALAGMPARAGMQVVLQGEYTNVTTTDGEGRYRFEGVPFGLYTVRASFGEFTREGEVTSLTGGEPGDDIEVPILTLTPAGAVAGRVTLDDGSGSGVAVTLDGTDILTSTDANGNFYLARVPIGEYRLRVEKPGYGGRSRRGVEVTFAEVTAIDPLVIARGMSADLNRAPIFSVEHIQMTRYRRAIGSVLDPLPLDLDSEEVARWDTVELSAPATDSDGDPLTYFWSVTAGALDRTDADTVRWTVSDKMQAQATITVRVVDQRSAAAFLSTHVHIADVQAQSGVLTADGRAVYAYRRFAGSWRVLALSIASGEVTRVGEIDSLDDPRVEVVGAHFHATPFSAGDRRHLFWRVGEAPVERTLSGTGRGMATAGRLVQQQDPVIIAYDPASLMSATLFDCGSGACGDVVATDDRTVVSLVRQGATMAHVYDVIDGTHTMLTLGSTGLRMRTNGSSVIFVDVPPGGGRHRSNNIVRTQLSGAAAQVYSGGYDVQIGAYDGRLIAFTEQGYRAVYSQPRALLRDVQSSQTFAIDPSSEWIVDDSFSLRERRLLVRHYPRADWLQDEDRTHYQLALRAVAP